jgi:hypothetical protein
MDTVLGIKFSIKLGLEPGKCPVPAVSLRGGLLFNGLDGVVLSPHPCVLSGPLRTR